MMKRKWIQNRIIVKSLNFIYAIFREYLKKHLTIMFKFDIIFECQ